MSIFDSIKKIDETETDIFSSINKQSKKDENKEDIKKELPELSNMYLPSHIVAIPHCFSQTSIYAPRASKNRNISHERLDIWSQGTINIVYEGPELDTAIDSRLMSLILKGRDSQKTENNIVRLKFKETMLALGLRPYHPNSRAKFTASIERHLSAKIHFIKGENEAGFWKSFFVAENTYYSYQNNILQIQLSNIIPVLFKMKDKGSFSIEDMVISFATKSSYATKLYSYYESNNIPFPVKVSTILEICDKKIEKNKKPTNNHRKIIKEALDELEKLGFLESWNFDMTKDKRDPLVVIKKVDKKSRKRDLEKEKQFNSNYLVDIENKKTT